MQKFDQHEHGLFIGADEFSSSVPCKVGKYGKTGPFDDEQINNALEELIEDAQS